MTSIVSNVYYFNIFPIIINIITFAILNWFSQSRCHLKGNFQLCLVMWSILSIGVFENFVIIPTYTYELDPCIHTYKHSHIHINSMRAYTPTKHSRKHTKYNSQTYTILIRKTHALVVYICICKWFHVWMCVNFSVQTEGISV